MNIAIFGDSFANGESDMTRHLSHYGLTQYLEDDGHFVINFSRQANANNQTTEDYAFNLRQNGHIKWDLAFVFQTEPVRQGDVWFDILQQFNDITQVVDIMIKDFYSNLREVQKIFGVPIYLIGGTADTLAPEEVEKFDLKCICQSLTNLCLNGEHLIEEPVLDYVFPVLANRFGHRNEEHHLIRDIDEKYDKKYKDEKFKEYYLNLLEAGENRYKTFLDNTKYFGFPDAQTDTRKTTSQMFVDGDDHPNRYAYKILYNHIKSTGILKKT